MRIWAVPIMVYVACDTDPGDSDAVRNALERFQSHLDGFYPDLIFPVAQLAGSRLASRQDEDIGNYLEALYDFEPGVRPELRPTPVEG